MKLPLTDSTSVLPQSDDIFIALGEVVAMTGHQPNGDDEDNGLPQQHWKRKGDPDCY